MPGTALSQLTGWMRDKRLTTTTDSAAAGVSRTLAATSGSASRAWDAVQAASRDLWDKYSKPAPWTDFKNTLGKYQGDLQRGDLELLRFSKAIKEAVPSKLDR